MEVQLPSKSGKEMKLKAPEAFIHPSKVCKKYSSLMWSIWWKQNTQFSKEPKNQLMS